VLIGASGQFEYSRGSATRPATALAATVAAGRASLQRARLDLENTTVRAPISGRTGQLLYKAGSLVRASADQLVTINELRPVLVRFPVPERDFEELRNRAGLDKALQVKVIPNNADTSRTVNGAATAVRWGTNAMRAARCHGERVATSIPSTSTRPRCGS
jgi:multidrug efflux system membrane fusion protein